MRIAVNTRLLLKNNLEGIGWYTYELMKRIVLAHPEHQFYFLFDRPFDEKYVFAGNVFPVVLYPPARHPLLNYLWFEWSVRFALYKYKIDVFFSPDGFLTLKTKIPTLLAVHDIAYEHFAEQIKAPDLLYYRKYMPKFVKRADKIITVSDFSKQDIIKHYNIDSKKISVVYNGCRSVFKPLDSDEIQSVRNKYSDGHNYFIYVGAIHPRKNLVRVIKAFDLFKRNNGNGVKFLIAGRLAWHTDEVKKTYENSTNKTDILFLDYVEDAELPRLMAAADALLYVSLFEGFGLPILEAMKCHTPVITSNITSMPEVAGNAALLVDPYSIQNIARAMKKILRKEVNERLQHSAEERIKRFSWDKSATQVFQMLEELAQTKKK